MNRQHATNTSHSPEPGTLQHATNVYPEPGTHLHQAIDAALAAPPAVSIPDDFAARVMASLPAPAPARRRRPVGPLAAVISSAVLAALLFAVAPRATPTFSSFAFDLELLLLAQLAAIAWWFAPRRHT